MSLSDSRKTGLLRLRHLQEVTEAKAEEMAEQAPRFARLAEPGSSPRVVSAPLLFQTPEPLAERMARLLDVSDGCRVLEPSAGLGRLYRAVRHVSRSCPVTLVDISPACCGELYRATEGDGACRLVSGDFLGMDAGKLGTFDRVIANPPFKRGLDITHIRHMLRLLSPAGRLVALCADGPKQRRALQPLASSWSTIPSGTFEGTGVTAALLVIEAGN